MFQTRDILFYYQKNFKKEGLVKKLFKDFSFVHNKAMNVKK